MRSTGLSGLVVVAVLCVAPEVDACGGCFSPPPPSPERAQVVTDHRMVLSLSATQTTLWDQIRYAGEPEDFVWVLPIGDASRVEIGLGDNAFIDAVDALSTVVIEARTQRCNPDGTGDFAPPSDYGSSGGGGCGGSSVDYRPGGGSSYVGPRDAGDTMLYGSESQTVGAMGQAVVGPYSVVIVRGAEGATGLGRWLSGNNYVVPPETASVVEHYAALRSDFVVVRLRPDAGVHQMQPVRVTLRGYVPTLPLRMVQAGIGDRVGLTLLVLANSEMVPRNYRGARIPAERITFDFGAMRSNYRDVFTRTLRESAEPTWITESVQQVVAEMMGYDPTRSDAGARDAAADRDAGEAADGAALAPADRYVDRRVAFTGLGGYPVLSRLRTELGVRALDRDLALDAADVTRGLGPRRQAGGSVNAPSCPPATRGSAGSFWSGDAGATSSGAAGCGGTAAPDSGAGSATSSRSGSCAASPRGARLAGPAVCLLATAALVVRRVRRRRR